MASYIWTSPYLASSNGIAERSVQTFKMAMKRMTGYTIESHVSCFLLKYQTTPTGVPLVELMFHRHLPTHLDLLQPSISLTIRVNRRWITMLMQGCVISKRGDDVNIHSFDGKNKWVPGSITTRQSAFSYGIVLDDDQVVPCHIGHISGVYWPVEATISFDDALL